LSQNVCDLRFPKAGRVIFQRDLVLMLVNANFAKAIGIRKFTQTRKLFVAQRRVQVIGDFHECHAMDYSSTTIREMNRKGMTPIQRRMRSAGAPVESSAGAPHVVGASEDFPTPSPIDLSGMRGYCSHLTNIG
jgi:hypothetical protein